MSLNDDETLPTLDDTLSAAQSLLFENLVRASAA